MKNDTKRGPYIRLVEKILGMVITRYKYSRILKKCEYNYDAGDKNDWKTNWISDDIDEMFK